MLMKSQELDNKKQKAQDKLRQIEVRLNEGTWANLWYWGYQISNADILDIDEMNVDKIVDEIKICFANDKYSKDDLLKYDYADKFKRAIVYYSKKQSFDKGIDLAEYAIQSGLTLPAESKSFEERIDTLLKKKERQCGKYDSESYNTHSILTGKDIASS